VWLPAARKRWLRDCWIRSEYRSNIAEYREHGPVQKCAIRVFKTWNDDEECKINPFAIEAAAIEELSGIDLHFHWCLQGLFFRCREISSLTHHPLDVRVPIVPHHNDDVSEMTSKLCHGLGLVQNAFFLAEMDDPEGALGYYLMLLDPDLAGESGEGKE
jgi:hypothetical protein